MYYIYIFIGIELQTVECGQMIFPVIEKLKHNSHNNYIYSYRNNKIMQLKKFNYKNDCAEIDFQLQK